MHKGSYSATAQDYVVDIGSSNTEYPFVIPAEATAIEFQCRDATEIRHSFTAGLVAGSAGAYQTLKANGVYKKDHLLFLSDRTIYFAAGSGSKKVEVRVWF